MRSVLPAAVSLLSFIILPQSAIAHNFNRPSGFAIATMPTSSKNEDSAVMRELKDTIKKQAAEIEAFKKSIGLKAVPSAGHGAPVGEVDMGYLKTPFYEIALQRVGWLSLFLGSLSLTALIMNGFEHTLSRQIELAYFVPLLAGHGGNTGGQVVGTILSALSSGAISSKDAFKVISKEAMTGFTTGGILGSCVGPLAHFLMGISLPVSVIVFITIPLVSTIASTLGSSIPFACVAVGLDPSVIAAPAMTSFVDVSGLMSYFLIANKIFDLFGLQL
jgi:cation transporter-like permease